MPNLNGPTGRVKLITWPYTSPAPAPGAAPTSVSSLPNHKAAQSPNPSTAAALHADTKLTGCSIQVVPRSAIDRTPSGPKLDALTAEKVFGWTSTMVPSSGRSKDKPVAGD